MEKNSFCGFLLDKSLGHVPGTTPGLTSMQFIEVVSPRDVAEALNGHPEERNRVLGAVFREVFGEPRTPHLPEFISNLDQKGIESTVGAALMSKMAPDKLVFALGGDDWARILPAQMTLDLILRISWTSALALAALERIDRASLLTPDEKLGSLARPEGIATIIAGHLVPGVDPKTRMMTNLASNAIRLLGSAPKAVSAHAIFGVVTNEYLAMLYEPSMLFEQVISVAVNREVDPLKAATSPSPMPTLTPASSPTPVPGQEDLAINVHVEEPAAGLLHTDSPAAPATALEQVAASPGSPRFGGFDRFRTGARSESEPSPTGRTVPGVAPQGGGGPFRLTESSSPPPGKGGLVCPPASRA